MAGAGGIPYDRRMTRFLAVLTLISALLGLSSTAAFADKVARIGVVAFPPGGATPRKSVSVFATYTWSPIFEALTAFAEDGTVIGDLAESWRATSPTTWEFKLRPGIGFSDGQPLTARDIVANLDWLRTPEARGTPVARQLDTVVAARAIDDLTVEVTTRTPNAVLPREISCLYIVHPGAWSRLGEDGFARAPIGTGPFMLASWDAARIVYAANARAWRKPKLDRLELLELAELTSRTQALLSGQIDAAIGMGPEEVNILAAGGFRLHQRRAQDVISLTLVVGAGGPLDDVRVRRALNHAVDKTVITDVILQGRTRAATQGTVAGNFGYDPTLTAYPYDLDTARALMKEAGVEKGFSFDAEVIVGSNAGDSAIYQFVADSLAKVNVKLNLISIPTQQMMRIINQGEWKGRAFSQVFGSWPTFDPLRTLRLHSCLWPKPWYCDPRITETQIAAMTEFDLEKRAALTRQVLRFYRDEATAILLHEIPILDGVSPRLLNYDPQKGRINYHALDVAS
jgi:peptide/nickel transport system substrate-binding protein